MSSYKDLIAWRKGMELVAMVYDATEGFPSHEHTDLSASYGGPPSPFPAILPKEKHITRIVILSDFSATLADPWQRLKRRL